MGKDRQFQFVDESGKVTGKNKQVVAVTNPDGSLVGGGGGGTTEVQGDVADDAVDSGNPVKIGGVADDNTIANASIGDRVKALFTLSRKLVIAGYDWALDAIKVTVQNPIWTRKTSREIIVEAADIASAPSTWANLGTQKSTIGYKKSVFWLSYTANDSVGAKVRIMARNTNAGIDYEGPEDLDYIIVLKEANKWYPFELDNDFPYLQLQGWVDVVGATEGIISAYITKGY